MRIVLATLAALVAGSALDTAKADPYRWCAQYAGRSGGTNCYFVTLAQCQAAISGNGGFCRVNGFYTGPEAAPRRVRRQG
jgi:hypothetical protein